MFASALKLTSFRSYSFATAEHPHYIAILRRQRTAHRVETPELLVQRPSGQSVMAGYSPSFIRIMASATRYSNGIKSLKSLISPSREIRAVTYQPLRLCTDKPQQGTLTRLRATRLRATRLRASFEAPLRTTWRKQQSRPYLSNLRSTLFQPPILPRKSFASGMHSQPRARGQLGSLLGSWL